MTRRYRPNIKTPLRIAVVGCGGTGSHVLSGLTHLHHALLALGGAGLEVVAYDPDTVAGHNVVRQRFYPSDVGRVKSEVLISRINRAYGLHWRSVPRTFAEGPTHRKFEVVIGCVDSRAGRAEIRRMVTSGPCDHTRFWLDIGNARFPDGRFGGQVVLGEPSNNRNWRSRRAGRLPIASELYPELVDTRLPEDDQPSCSALESLKRQDLFLNALLAQHALNILWRVLLDRQLDVTGVFLDASSHVVMPVHAPNPAPLAEAS